PILLTAKSEVSKPEAEVDPIAKRAVRFGVEVEALKEYCAQGVEVPAAICPTLFTVKNGTEEVAKPLEVVEAITKSAEVVLVLFAWIANCAYGEVVPIPTRFAKFAIPLTIS